MNRIPEECIEFFDKRKICVAEERGKKYELRNDSGFRIKKVKANFCLSQKAREKRCDYLFCVDDIKQPVVFFIELKGGDIVQAIRQVVDTVLFLKPGLENHVLNVRIIGSRNVPQIMNTPDYRKLASVIRPSSGTIKKATNYKMSESI